MVKKLVEKKNTIFRNQTQNTFYQTTLNNLRKCFTLIKLILTSAQIYLVVSFGRNGSFNL